ncbi:hypothetical protein E4T25_04320 [Photobacterium damselae subsp. piscicida]|uniref:hypothetical protein n=1 Tax=Photobacterium damselae TaxID=38293 RepID=UPI0010769C04|nr:hypothetical protein [Photobacterium damselae]TFZ62427.1 hypothetical protein E4T25_04320 [Photobacterium damselae subsp. piscicida]
MKTFNQLLFFKDDQITLLEQWKNCDEYGLTTKQFCEALIENGTAASKEIGLAGKDAPAHGQHFTDVLTEWMPPMIVCAIATAEKAGDRQAGLEAAINQLQGGQNIILKIIQALWFPFVLLIVTGALGLYVSDEILKSLGGKGGMGQTMNTIVSTFGLPLAIFSIVLLIAIAFALPLLTGSLRQHLDSFPIFSLYKTATAASVLNTLGNLLACGLKLDDALQAIGSNSIPYVQAHIERMRQQRIGQMNLGKIIDTGLILPFELGTLKILGSHAQYATLLLKSARNHRVYVDKRLRLLSSTLNKIGLLLVILLLGGLIGTAIAQLLSTVNF